MATTKKQISYGSSGSDVSELQTLLNQNGYNLNVDGIFGAKTQDAVKDYQQKNSLAVDGIVGTNTWGALAGANSASTATSNTSQTTSAPKAPEYNYQESDSVSKAYEALQQQMAQKPGSYQSPWQASLDEALKKIQNREKFSYDFNADALYQQYKDRYIQQGQQAMMDTMGQASAMTGGYGNSYAQTAGQQTYQGYLQGLNDKIPELAALAQDAYNQETQNLYNQFAMYGDLENQDYNRYRDQMSDYNAALDRLQNRYDTEREWDYNKYLNDYSQQYQNYRDTISDSQWQKEFDEAQRQYNETLAFNKQQAGLSGSSGSSSGSSSKKSSSSKSSGSSSGGSSSSKTSGKTYSNGMSSSEIANIASAYYKAHPNVPLDSRTIDVYANQNGITGDALTAFRAYLQQYGMTTSGRR